MHKNMVSFVISTLSSLLCRNNTNLKVKDLWHLATSAKILADVRSHERKGFVGKRNGIGLTRIALRYQYTNRKQVAYPFQFFAFEEALVAIFSMKLVLRKAYLSSCLQIISYSGVILTCLFYMCIE